MGNVSEIQEKAGKLVILSAPSGAGKTTIMKHIVKTFPELEFSVSATSRAPRHTERDGTDYYFMSPEEFRELADGDKFVEWEEVYAGTCYGTLRSEMERIWAKGNTIIFDVDVKGGINLKNIFGKSALAIFIMPPSVEELRHRLVARGTDSVETIEKRVAKAEVEIGDSRYFDKIVVNDKLDVAIMQVEQVVGEFLKA